MSKTKVIPYSKAGVDYKVLDAVKRLAQLKAKSTSPNLLKFGMHEVGSSRGESAYVWEENDSYRAIVIEGLGTKNKIADEVRKADPMGPTYYDVVAWDTVAMIINDLIVVGAEPQVVNAYFAVGNPQWFNDKRRASDLIKGWAKATKASGAVWGGGETPSLKEVIEPDTIDLAGSAVGIIKPKKHLILGDKIKAGDKIILLESSGIHANGLTLARKIGKSLTSGYSTKLPDGKNYGRSLLKPTTIYAALVKDLLKSGVEISYMVNITGHGWRKLMRASAQFTYVISKVPKPQVIFDFIKENTGNSDTEMYGNFNMGAGYAVYIPEKYVSLVNKIASRHKIKALEAGYVEKGEKQVVIEPKSIVFKSASLEVRG